MTFCFGFGKFVDSFEEEMAKNTGAEHAIVCVNGVNALHIALQLSGVTANDDGITQSLTFIATANAGVTPNAIILKDKTERDSFLTESNDRPIWKLMSHLPMFKDCPKGDLSNAEWLEERVVNIPSSVK